ncbi:TetR/AcrR family transcriptional regulator [Syntrophomonas palmitatica]|uniref:TetR/AcrR family transcriptional regulator n=1 Tax=Syntrophomonas palmitatica TaxID=402877 RepID=UPI0006D04EAB|nr:TetR/AcrR family transcriptional regulator [Syntrophomonas palmitatica]
MRTSRKEVERSFKKDFVGEIALELFRHKPYERVSMDEIARKAEFGKGTLYKLFSGKEDIMVHVICRGIEKLRCDLQEQCMGSSDPRQAMKALLELEYDFYTEYSNLVLTLVFRQNDNFAFAIMDRVRAEHQQLSDLLEQIFERARTAGMCFRMDNQELIRALEAAMKG